MFWNEPWDSWVEVLEGRKNSKSLTDEYNNKICDFARSLHQRLGSKRIRYTRYMKSLGRTLIQIGQQALTARGADMRPAGIDPTWSHTLAQPTL